MPENDLNDLFSKRKEAEAREAEEDEAVLEGSGEEQPEEPIVKTIVDNGQFDYDIEEADKLNFHPGQEIAKHFPEISAELIDKYGDAVEDVYKRSMAANVYFKSLSDQITQKGRNVSDDFTRERAMLEKALELKLEIALVKGVGLDKDVEDSVVGCLVEKSFGRSDAKKESPADKIMEKLEALQTDVNMLGSAVARRKKGEEL